jgi:hypothetical protein
MHVVKRERSSCTLTFGISNENFHLQKQPKLRKARDSRKCHYPLKIRKVAKSVIVVRGGILDAPR